MALVDDRQDGPTGLISLAGLVAVLLATLSFVPIVQGLDWWSAAIVFSAAAVGATALARALGARPIASGILGLCPLPLLAIALDGDGRGLAVLLPTPESAAAVNRVLLAAGYQIYQESVPATSSPGVVLLIAAGAAVAAVLVDVVAVGFGAPLGAVPVVVALAIVPGKALRTPSDGWMLAAVAVALLLLVAADRRRRGASPRALGLVTTGAAGLVVALVGSFILPAPAPSEAQALPVQPLFGPGADPLIRLGDNLRRGPKQDALTYSTTSTTPVYLRLAVLERFSGATWYPNEADAGSPVVPGRAAPKAPGVPTSGRTATTTIVPASPEVVGARLPLPYPATEVRGVSGFSWDVQGLTAVRQRDRAAIDRYVVTNRVAQPSRSDLQSALATTPPDDASSMTLPERVPAIITRTAESWTRKASTDYAKALAIQNQLRAGAFLYDENTPAREGYDGDGLAVIARFLQVKSGYCVHFASTMAVMARVLDIPSRVVVGYQPGKKATRDGRTEYDVSSTDLHAWPELYFAGQGWVRFEPTPGRGAVPAYAPVPGAGPNGTATATPTPTAGAVSGGPQASADPQSPAEVARRTADVWRTIGTIAALVGGAILVLALPGVVRMLARRRRLAKLREGGAAALGWREVVDTGADLGMPPPDGSPRVMAASLDARLHAPDARAALGRIRDAFEVQTFGRRSPTVSADDVRVVVDRLRSVAGRGARLRGTVAPVSLLGRLRRPRLALRWTPPGSGGTTRAARLGRLSIRRRHANRSRP